MTKEVYLTDCFNHETVMLTIPDDTTMEDTADEFQRALNRAYKMGRNHHREEMERALDRFGRAIRANSVAQFIDDGTN